MKIPCHIIQDLLPLYIEQIDSDETHHSVDKHLESCHTCQIAYEQLSKNAIDDPPSLSLSAFQHVKIKLFRDKLLTIILCVLITFSIGIISIGYLTSPIYEAYSSELIQLEKTDSGALLAYLSSSSLNIELTTTQTAKGAEHSIMLYRTLLNRLFDAKNNTIIVINPKAEDVHQVYYIQANGQNDVILFGQGESDYQISLPRLALNYYLLIAIFIFLVIGILNIIFSKLSLPNKLLIYLLPLPLSYIIAHLLVVGLSGTTFSILHDFFTILLLCIPIYSLLLLLKRMFQKPKNAI